MRHKNGVTATRSRGEFLTPPLPSPEEMERFDPTQAELFFGDFTRWPKGQRIPPFLRQKRFFTRKGTPDQHEILFFFECRGCHRRAYYDPNLDPNRLQCSGCGMRNPDLKQEYVKA